MSDDTTTVCANCGYSCNEISVQEETENENLRARVRLLEQALRDLRHVVVDEEIEPMPALLKAADIIESALQSLGSEYTSPAGWEDRVRGAVAMAHDAGACSHGLGICTTRDCDGAIAILAACQSLLGAERVTIIDAGRAALRPEPELGPACSTCDGKRRVLLCPCGWAALHMEAEEWCPNCGCMDSIERRPCPDCVRSARPADDRGAPP